ncbi:MAG: HAMP domain-containing histidine kinase [Ekhidna sp.]|nr:HAMP domain-containing histidine kinase [Ekhidna sp.]
MNWLNSFFEQEELENQLFLVALIVTIPYFTSSIIFDILHKSYFFLALDGGLLLFSLTMLFLFRIVHLRVLLIRFFSLLTICASVFYWISSGGISGGGAYIFPIVSLLVILINKGIGKYLFTALLIGIVLLIANDLIPGNAGNPSYRGLLYDFILNLCMFAILLVVFKRFLDRERLQLEERKEEINRLNAKLNIKTTELELYNRDLEIIKKNLEKVADRHNQSLAKENQRIMEYSFINAHLLRAPLTNIIGISELIEEKSERVKKLEKVSKRFDSILFKINSILSEERAKN